MDLHEQRMQCLKMAFELGGKPEAVLSAAQQLLDFITGPPSATPKDVFDIEAAAAPSQPEETASEASAVEEAVSDPIAACGTALIMEEGQDLADAVPAAFETAATGDAAPAADAPETPSEVGTIEEAGEAPPVEAREDVPAETAGEIQSEAVAEEAPIEQTAVEEAAASEEPAEVSAAAAEPTVAADGDGSGEAAAAPA
jgi:hypothetical protein